MNPKSQIHMKVYAIFHQLSNYR